MKTFKNKLMILGLAFAMVSCGNNDPLAMFDEPLPQLNSINLGAVTYGLAVPFSPSSPYWRFNTSITGTMVSPARGFVAEIGLDTQFSTGSYYVKIIHSGRMSTKIVGITSAVLVRPGDYVAQGAPVGTFFGGVGNSILQVVVDNKAVCPLSFMSDTFRSTFYTGVGAFNPCQ